MLSGRKVIAGIVMGLLVAGPMTAAQAGLFDWLFKRKHHKTEQTQYQGPNKLDSSARWKCHVGGGCKGGKGICCVDGMQSHFKGIKGIEKVEVDRKNGTVLLTIKAGEEVNVKEIQESLGGHWTIKTVEKQQT